MPFTEKQRVFLDNANHRWNIKSGATRSGKTYLDYFVIPKRIRNVAGKEGLVVLLGNTKGTLQRNVIEPLQAIWGTDLVSDIKSDNTAYLFGEKAYCLGADKVNQVNRIRGASIKYCYGDEVVTWHKDVFDMLKSRLDKPYSKFDGTCNPDNPRHWFKEFIDSDADIYCQEYCIDDNAFLSKDFVDNLKKEYYGTVLYDRYILGKWVLAEGLVYGNFNEERTCINDFEEKGYAEYYISLDYGITNPFCAILWRVERRCAYAIDMYYFDSKKAGYRKTDEEHYQAIERLAKDYFIENIVLDPSCTSFKETIARHDKYSYINANNDVLSGIGNTAMLLNTEYLKIVRDKCKPLIEEFGLYRWNEESLKDEVIKENDHCMDALRYFINTILKYEFDWLNWSLKE